MSARVVVKPVVLTVSVVAVLAACLWGSRFLFLMMFSDEGPMPPRWRIPAVPAGATVVEDTMMCASGGCWWSLLVQPPPGRTPEELARQMGVATERTEPPTLTDPGFVYVGSHIRSGRVEVYVGYE